MSSAAAPSVEFIQGPSREPAPARRGRRLVIFLAVFVLGAIAGELWNFSRPSVYRASATVLTVKARAVDGRSEDADPEHVAIQARALLDDQLLDKLAQALNQRLEGSPLTRDGLRAMLDITPLEGTNLIELSAHGAYPLLLQTAINTWTGLYEELRQQQIVTSKQGTLTELSDELAALRRQIDQRQASLAMFREEHDIVSLEREENRAPAELRGLNQSLNKARERLVEAQAARAAIDSRAAQGATVIPREQRAAYTQAEVEARKLREQLADLEERFTEAYIERDPELRSLPQRIEEFDEELRAMRELGLRQSIEIAEEELAAARAAVSEIERRITAHESGAQRFTSIFREHQSQEKEIARLEELANDVAERMTRLESRNLDRYPPVEVVDHAALPTEPVSPDFTRDALVVLGFALAVALFVTWLVEYLTRSNRPEPGNMTGVRVYAADPAAGLASPAVAGAMQHTPTPGLTAPPAALAAPVATILEPAEVDQLLRAATPPTQCLAMLLLCGVQPQEFARLDTSALERQRNCLVLGDRELTLEEPVAATLEAAANGGDFPLNLGTAALDAALAVAAIDAGDVAPERVTAMTLAHTYAVHLVRQGARLADLPQRLGALPAERMQTLARYSPPGPNRPLQEIDTTYPLFR